MRERRVGRGARGGGGRMLLLRVCDVVCLSFSPWMWWLMGGADDFEVAVFLTETSTRHSILRKEKRARTKKERLGSTNGRLIGTRDAPVEIADAAPGLVREESDEVRLADLPAADEEEGHRQPTVSKEESGEGLFVSDGDDDGQEVSTGREMDRDIPMGGGEGVEDDKKKLSLNTTYDGFSIYGRILCLVVKRKATVKGKEVAVGSAGSGQAMMEEWISSTQMAEGQMMDD